jgi:hypothetical protein
MSLSPMAGGFSTTTSFRGISGYGRTSTSSTCRAAAHVRSSSTLPSICWWVGCRAPTSFSFPATARERRISGAYGWSTAARAPSPGWYAPASSEAKPSASGMARSSTGWKPAPAAPPSSMWTRKAAPSSEPPRLHWTDLGTADFRTLAWSPDGQTLAAPTRERGSRTITLHSMGTGESRVFWLDEDVLLSGGVGGGRHGAVRESRRSGEEPSKGLLTISCAWTWSPGPPRGCSRRRTRRTTPLWRFLVTPDGRSIVLRQQRTLDDDRTEMKLVLRSLEDGSERELHRTSGFHPGVQHLGMGRGWRSCSRPGRTRIPSSS